MKILFYYYASCVLFILFLFQREETRTNIQKYLISLPQPSRQHACIRVHPEQP